MSTLCFEAQLAEMASRHLRGAGIRIGQIDTALSRPAAALALRARAHRVCERGMAIVDADPEPRESHASDIARLLVDPDIGLAPDAELLSVEALEAGHTPARLVVALDWLISERVDVIVMPLGLPVQIRALDRLLDIAAGRGIVTVMAIGNGGPGRGLHPAAGGCGLSVGAGREVDGGVLPWSGSVNERGTTKCLRPDLLAPTLAQRLGRPADSGGTSLATAVARGVAALLRQSHRHLPAEAIRAAMVETCQPLPERAGHRACAGLLNPLAGLLALDRHPTSARPTPAATPRSDMAERPDRRANVRDGGILTFRNQVALQAWAAFQRAGSFRASACAAICVAAGPLDLDPADAARQGIIDIESTRLAIER